MDASDLSLELLTQDGPVHEAVKQPSCALPHASTMGLSLTCALLFLAKAPLLCCLFVSFFTLVILCTCGVIL